MGRYEIRVVPHGSLYLGGYTAGEGKGANITAQDQRGVLIPGSALKGALRESALRLLRGAHLDEAPVVQLFGDRSHLVAGKLRFGPLHVDGDQAKMEASTRHHVSLQRTTRSAAPQRLFRTRVTPTLPGLTLRGELEVLEELEASEWDLLRAAVSMTDQLGGGRGRGLGCVQLELDTEPLEVASGSDQDDSPAFQLEALLKEHGSHRRDLLLGFEVLEPLQLGWIKDRSNLEPTTEILGGSVLRGAVAAALGRSIPRREERERVLEEVLGPADPVLFGDGLPATRGVVAPLTLLRSKDGAWVEDRAIDLVAGLLGGRSRPRPPDAKSAKGCWRRAEMAPDTRSAWHPVPLPRRTVTRSARNPIDGRSKDGQLYSIEVIDPAFGRLGGNASPESLSFYATVRGPADSLRRVVEASRGGLLVGGTRSRGFGRIRLTTVSDPKLDTLTTRHQRWIDALVGRGVDREAASRTGVLLALGCIAMTQPRLENALQRHRLVLLGGESRRRPHGGWNSRVNLPRTSTGVFVPGSVFLVQHQDGSIFEALRDLEEQGLGPGRADGWGRVVACHPIHTECLAGPDARTHEERS